MPGEPAGEKDNTAVSETEVQVFDFGPRSAASGEQSMLHAKWGLQVTDGCAKHGKIARTAGIFETMRTAGVIPIVGLSGKAAGRSTMHAAAFERRRQAGSGKGRGTAPATGCGPPHVLV